MKLVLLRHGERENSGTSNPPLSPRGVQQAIHLADLVRRGQLPTPNRLMCSPRLRTQMTLVKTSDNLNIPLQVMAELDERIKSETQAQFAARIKKVLHGLSRTGGVVFICTHLDWLEVSMHEIPCETDLTLSRYESSWAPGHLMVFNVSPELWTFEKMETLPL